MEYTRQVEDQYFSFADEKEYRAKLELENMSEDASEKQWKKKIEEIAEEYCYSFRYFLVRFLLKKEPQKMPSMEDVKALSEETLKEYEEALLNIARSKNDFSEKRAKDLIQKAMLDKDKKVKKKELLMTREEAFELGHILRFSLGDMKACLVRVLENDDGFSLKCANDLIEIYGFLQELSAGEVAELKRAYKELTDTVEKRALPEEDVSFTKELETSIITKISEWEILDREERDQHFLTWLEEKSPYLDVPSRNALRVYRNLVAYAYDCVINIEKIPSEEDLLDAVKEVTNNPKEVRSVKQYFYDAEGNISVEKCKKAVEKLMEVDVWKIVNARADGKAKSDSCAEQITSILTGETSPQKADILYVLWFIEGVCWVVKAERSDGDLFNRIADLCDLADDTLRLALLPEFYPPHLLEQSMLLSIVNSKEQNPADVYDMICDALLAKKRKTTGARKHSSEEKLKAVLEFIENPKNIQAIAEKYEASPKSIYGWKAKYQKGGNRL